ncbi:MAG: hypothetical protein R3C15_21665 [Thermoleophilia bacterium]
MRRLRVSPALVVALVALFVALGGGAYAGVTLATNSVRTATIANGHVRAADLASTAVTAAKLKAGAVTAAKLAGGVASPAKLADLAAGERSLAEAAATAVRIADGAATTSKLAPGAGVERALGETAVTNAKLADASVGSVQLADGSVGDVELAGGIAASKLTGPVAEAAAADVATTAAAVNGVAVRRVDFRGATGQSATVLELGGLTLAAVCSSGTTFTVRASTDAGGAMLHVAGIDDTQQPRALEDEDLQPGEQPTVFPIGGPATDALVASLVYSSPTGGVVRVTFRGVRPVADGPCLLQGVARHAAAP